MKKIGLVQNVLILATIACACNFSYGQNMQLSGGYRHTIALCQTGTVMHAGDRNDNQAGVGFVAGDNLVLTNVPGVGGVGNLTNIQMIDAGSTHHTIALTNSGDVIAFGNDYACQLGQGSAAYPTNPVYVKAVGGVGNLTGIKYIVGSSESSYAIRASDGALIAWGNNTQGQLGLGTITTQECTPKLVGSPLNSGVVQVDGGDNFTLALKNDGTVYGIGENLNGQLGIGNTTDQSTPQQVLISPGVPLNNVVSISCGDGASYAIRSDGTLWAWGHNGWGQLGLGNCTLKLLYATRVVTGAQGHVSGFLQNVKQVAGGNAHAVVVLNDGTVYTMGSDQYGQLGDGTIGGADACGNGVGCRNAPYKVASLTNISAVSDGDLWSFAVTNSGTVYSWGQNDVGQLSINSTTSTATPTLMSMGPCTILPVAMISFEAKYLEANTVVLHWSTASEDENKQFEIERSFDGIHFESIGMVKAAGTTKSTSAYEFYDLLSGNTSSKIYYRLKIVGADNQFTYSAVKVISIVSSETELTVYPNPAASGKSIGLSFQYTESSTVPVKLFDLTGKEVAGGHIAVVPGANDVQFLLPELSKGMYTLKVLFPESVSDKKIVVQ